MNIHIAPLASGSIKNDDTSMYPSRFVGHVDGKTVFDAVSSTVFGIVLEGAITLQRDDGSKFELTSGMYFSCPGKFVLQGVGKAAAFERLGYRGLFQIGGPVETHGRLCYIDNCRSTILVGPPRVGDPCLNLLTFPAKTEQTMHIHPTIRMGVVLAGQGHCVLGDGTKMPLKTGVAFYLGEAAAHCFHTGTETMTVIAYHPDSDVGPTDASHPMLTRTYTKF